MLLKRFTGIALLLVCAGPAAAQEEVHWTAPGWYGVADAIDWGWIVTGPFYDQQTCNSSLPSNYDEVEHYCEYLNERPRWDF